MGSSIRFFGPFAYSRDDLVLPPPRPRKIVSLLALLLLRAGRDTERSFLAETLWPDSAPEGAALNLRRLLSDLRDYLGADAGRLRSPSRRTVCFTLTDATVDVLGFDAAVQRHARTQDPAAAEEAVRLHGAGRLLEGFDDTWVQGERTARETACLHLLDTLALQALRTDDPARAEGFARQALALDPLREPALRLLCESQARTGDRAAALRTFHAFRDRLHRAANQRPDAQTLALIERITHAPLAAAAVPPRPEVLPAFLTPLVGRTEERAAVIARLSLPDVRLVTLLGMGGTGKTRLAVAAAQTDAARAAFPGGTFFVDLSPLAQGASADTVWQAVADALAVTVPENATPRAVVPERFDALARAGRGPVLLLLDNAEHLLAGATGMALALLAAAPNAVRIATTSRFPLGVPGEHLQPVPPLPPADALALLLSRLQAVRPDFVPAETDRAHLEALCRRLDGLPLALELVAARLRVLPPERVLALLEDRFRLLSGGSAALPERQRTLEATIAWSWNLLHAEERVALARLSVLPGGFLPDLAHAVAEADDLLLAALAGHSLLAVDGTGRYRMLDTIRAFATLRLAETPDDEAATRARLAAWAVTYADTFRDALWGEQGGAWMERTRAERENLRAAMDAAPVGDALRILHDLFQFWWRRSEWHEGLNALASVLARPDLDPDCTGDTREYLLAARTHRAHCHRFLGEPHDLEARLREHGAYCRAVGNRASVYLLHSLGDLLAEEGRFAEALPPMREGLELARGFGEEPLVAYQLRGLCRLHFRAGDTDAACRCGAESVALFRAHRLPTQLVLSLADLGEALLPSDPMAAIAALTEALALARDQQVPDMEGEALASLVRAYRLAGEADTARDYLGELHALARTRDDTRLAARAAALESD